MCAGCAPGGAQRCQSELSNVIAPSEQEVTTGWQQTAA